MLGAHRKPLGNWGKVSSLKSQADPGHTLVQGLYTLEFFGLEDLKPQGFGGLRPQYAGTLGVEG